MHTDVIPISADARIISRADAVHSLSTHADIERDKIVPIRPTIPIDTATDSPDRDPVSFRTQSARPQTTAEPISEIRGAILELTDPSVFCEVYVGAAVKHVSIQKDLFPQNARIAMPISIVMEDEEGLTRFAIRERAPDPVLSQAGNDEINALLNSL